MGEWSETTLDQVCDLQIGGTPSRNVPEFWDRDKAGQNRWVSIRDLNGKYIDETKEYITDLGVKNSNVKLCQKDDILLSFKLTIGKTAIAATDLYTNEAIVALTPKKNMDRDYLYYGLQHWNLLSSVDQAIKGATLNKEKLKKIVVSYPTDLETQKNIGLVLNCIDDAIEKISNLIDKQRSLKTCLIQDLMTNGIDDNGQIRSETTHNFRTSSLGRVPGDWEVEKLERLVKEPITYGIVQAGPHIDGGIPYIRTGDMRDNNLYAEGLLRTSPAIAASYKRSEVHTDDIVFALRATVGKVLLVPAELDGANLTQGTAKISPKQEISHLFLLWAMRDYRTSRQIELVKKGTTFEEITLANLRALQISYPRNLDEQVRIVSILEAQEESIIASTHILNKLHRIKHGLLRDLLTGKVPVPATPGREEPPVEAVA